MKKIYVVLCCLVFESFIPISTYANSNAKERNTERKERKKKDRGKNDTYTDMSMQNQTSIECCNNHGCDYDYETPQEIYLYDLLTKEKQLLFRSHQKVKHKEGKKDVVEWSLYNFIFPKFVEDEDGAALLLWEIDHGNDGYLFPLNEHNIEKKYFYPYDYFEYELNGMINSNDTHKYAWYDWECLQYDNEQKSCSIGYYRFYKINTKGDIIWEDDSVNIFRYSGESPIGGEVIAKAPANILHDMDDFKRKLSSFLRDYPEYGNASMGVKYLLEVTYTTYEYFCSHSELKKETEVCNIAFEISQDTRTILNEGTNGYIPELILIDDSLKIFSSPYCQELSLYKGKTLAFKGRSKTKKIEDLGFVYKDAILFNSAHFNTKNISSFKVLSVEEEYQHRNEVTYSNCEVINEEYTKVQESNNGNHMKEYEEEILEEKKENSHNNFKTDFKKLKKMPEFQGGSKGLSAFIAENIQYPVEAQDLGLSGTVIVKFVVNTQGGIEDIEIEKSVHPLLDKAAIDVIEKLPKFVPGEDENGEKIPAPCHLPIVF